MEQIPAFDGLRGEEEQLLGVYRKSIVPYSSSLSFGVIAALFLLVVAVLLPGILSMQMALLLSLIIVGVSMARVWYLWSKSVIMITNLRIIALEQKGLFHRELQEAIMADICNVAARVKGMSATLFHFGDVLVQTEAEWWIEKVNKPYELKEAIFDALHDRKHREVQTLPKRFWSQRSRPRRRVVIHEVDED